MPRDDGVMDRSESVVVAVPAEVVLELEREGLATRAPVRRGPILDAIVTIGADSATLVTLLQGPDSVRAFARWVHGRCERSDESIDISIRRADQQVHLVVEGNVDVGAVADFLATAFPNPDKHES
jgi:hypothetical protein